MLHNHLRQYRVRVSACARLLFDLKVILNCFILMRMVPCCHHVVTMMSELVPARERTNRADKTPEPILPSVLLKVTSASTLVSVPALIPFLGVYVVSTGIRYYVLDTLVVICSHRLPYTHRQFAEHYGRSQIQQSVLRIRC